MRSTLALFFIALIAVSNVSAVSQDVNYMKSLKNTKFGQTLVESIQVELQTSSGADSVDRILNLLKEIKDQLLADDKADKEKFAAYKATTEGQIAQLAQNVIDFTASIKEDRNLIELNNAAIAAATSQLKQQRKELASDRQLLKENQETQAETTRVYKKQFAQLSSYIAGLAKARTILKSMFNKDKQVEATSFVQVQEHIDNMQFAHPKFEGFMAVLSEMMSSSERVHGADHVNAVLDLVDSLYDQLVKEAETLTAVYKRRMADLQVIEARYEVSIAVHETTIAGLESKIARHQASNVEAEQRILNNQERRSEAQQESKDLQKSLKDETVAHNSRVHQRAEEVEIIDHVVEIFKTRLTDEVRSSVAVL